MAYPHKWSPISSKSSAGQRKDTGQKPMLYRWTTQPPNKLVLITNRNFSRLSIHGLAAKIQPDKVVRWCQNGDFLRPVFSACPKLQNRSEPLVGRSSPDYKDMWRRHCCLTSLFFRLPIHALVAKIQPDKVVRWCRDGDFLRHFCVLCFQRAACSTFQSCVLNSLCDR